MASLATISPVAFVEGAAAEDVQGVSRGLYKSNVKYV